MLIKKNTFTTDAAARRVALLSGARGLRTKYLGALKARIIKKRRRMQQGGHHTSIDIAGLGGGGRALRQNTRQVCAAALLRLYFYFEMHCKGSPGAKSAVRV